MNLQRAIFFLAGCTVILLVFAFVWPYLAPSYAWMQIRLARPAPSLQFAVDAEGIAVYQGDKSLVRRDFTSFGGLGLMLALWLVTPSLGWRRRLLFTMLGLVLLFFFHVLVLWSLIAFTQALESGRAVGLYTLLYSFIAVSDWVVPVLFWGLVGLRYLSSGSGATP